uniref:Meiotic double-stranded break formation protein 4 n=1 Tax=Anolis carolinensis TaxID=28377 RepID=R4GA84_ANOCA|nr:PREDICTED: meiosis-specific protein MEI4-like [Anolis carolinensis]|eukprot:XP_008120223.1 PREDICTED: meiosis-specific protein MEI4-like [Anolis carolinensis]
MEAFDCQSVNLDRSSRPLFSGRRAPAEIKHEEVVVRYLKTSQLALALAIIRSKPPDKSSKEYAEHLAKIVSGQDFKWKSRIAMLEAEVLHLRQQLLLRKTSSGLRAKHGPSDETPPLPITEEFSDHLEDSGCDISNHCMIDTLETLPSFSHRSRGCNSCASEPLSSRIPIWTSCKASKQKSLISHMQFLQNFFELRKLTKSGGLKTDLEKLGIDCSIISHSFSQLLDGLVTSYSLPELPFLDVTSQAVSLITKLLNDVDISNLILGKCLKKLEDCMKRLLAIVLNSSSLNRFQMQESISHALVLLGQCSTLRNSTISLLFGQVCRFTDELQHANKIQAKYSIQYENVFFLCRILEQLLESQTEQENLCGSGCGEEEKKKFLQNLNQAIFHLSDQFPLFCIYLWRLGTLLNATQIQTGERNGSAL